MVLCNLHARCHATGRRERVCLASVARLPNEILQFEVNIDEIVFHRNS